MAKCDYSTFRAIESGVDVMPLADSSPSVGLRKKAISAGVWNIGALVTSQAFRLGGNLIMARLLMPEMFGVMMIATTVSVVLHLLSDVGLRQNIIQSPRGDDPVSQHRVDRADRSRAHPVCLDPADRGCRLVCASPQSVGEQFHLRRTRVATGIGRDRSAGNHLWLAVDESRFGRARFPAEKVVIAEFVSQFAGLLAMLAVGYFTRSIWSLVVAGLVSAIVSTAMGHLWFEGRPIV